MLSYPSSAHECDDVPIVYSEDELRIISTVEHKKKASNSRLPVESVLAFLPLHVKYQAWSNVSHLKTLLEQDYKGMKPWDVKGTHKTLIHIMNNALQKVSFARSRANTVAIYVSTADQKISYLPYRLRTILLYNKPLSITSILPAENNSTQQYIALVFSNSYASFFQGCGNTLTPVSRLFVKNNDDYVKDTDPLLEGFIVDNALPIFVFGLPDMVNHFVNLTIWKFNIADTFFIDGDVKAPFIRTLLQLWFKQQALVEIPDNSI